MGMHSANHPSGRISFTFFGVPTTIHPSSWLVLLILGSGMGSSQLDFSSALIFVVVGMLCLLVHEYGHAFIGRAMGGGRAEVEIASLGGVTTCAYPPRTRMGHLLMVLAGPGASLMLAVLGGVVLGLHLGVPVQKGVCFALTFPLPFDMPEEFMEENYVPVLLGIREHALGYLASKCYFTLFFVSVWWSIFNLLPIFPMDGGKALYLISDDKRLTGAIGLITAIILFVWALCEKMFFTDLICAWFAWINWNFMRQARE